MNGKLDEKKQLTRVKEKKSLPVLPFEMLEIVASFIKNGYDFMNWLRALEKYPTIGNFSLILDFEKEIQLGYGFDVADVT